MSGKAVIDQLIRTPGIGAARRWWNRITPTRGSSKVDAELRIRAQHQAVRIEVARNGLYINSEEKILEKSEHYGRCLYAMGVLELTLPQRSYAPGNITSILDTLASRTLEDMSAVLGKEFELELCGVPPLTWSRYLEDEKLEGRRHPPTGFAILTTYLKFLILREIDIYIKRELARAISSVYGQMRKMGAAPFDYSSLALSSADEIAAYIVASLPKTMLETGRFQYDFSLAAEIINWFPPTKRPKILTALKKLDKDLANSVRPFVVS